ncbi:hypothetical protein YTPLAS18_04530 [Nitrospira sp.]|nr:hypothetical protein YTPLAS18_04530 [Nitrospira sp.]
MVMLILVLVLASATALFALQNTDTVIIQFLLWRYQTSLVLVILGSFTSGVALAILASVGGRLRRRRDRRSLESTIESQQNRIRDLEDQVRSVHETSPSS